MPKLNLLLFLGQPQYPDTPTRVEEAMDALLLLTLRSTLDRAQQTKRFDRFIVVTNQPQLNLDAKIEVIFTPPTEKFHFGRVMQKVISQAHIGSDEGVVYFGAGAGALLNDQEWKALLDTVQNNPNSVTANNYFSADLVGWQPAQAIFNIDLTTLNGGDNNLAFALCRQAGLTWRTFLPANTRTFGTQFDLDTPSDAALLKLWLSRSGQTAQWPRLATFLETTSVFDTIPVSRVLAEFSDFSSEILVSGRVSGQTHRLLESKVWGQTRIISEERGLRVSGREDKGQAVSLLGSLLQSYGAERFFKFFVARTCRAAILDTRVLFAHLHLKPTRRDRFNSDAFQPQLIRHATLRTFTQAAQTVDLPIIMGGHTVVAGGLMLLLDLVPPKPYD